jgi:hypothetical protein
MHRATNQYDTSRVVAPNLPEQARLLFEVNRVNPSFLKSLKELNDSQTRLPSRKELRSWALSLFKNLNPDVLMMESAEDWC